MASRGRYGSRSVERSLHYPQGFHDPFKSLSPIAARFASESAGKPSYPATVTVTPSHTLLVQNQRITTQSIVDFGSQTIALLEKLEVDHPHLDAVEAAAFPALTVLLNRFKEFKHGGGMTIEEILDLEETVAVFLRTLDWTATASLTSTDRAGLLVIRKNIREAIRHLKWQRERGVMEDRVRARVESIKYLKGHAAQLAPDNTSQLRLENIGTRMITRAGWEDFSPEAIKIAGKTGRQGFLNTDMKSGDHGADGESIDYYVHGW